MTWTLMPMVSTAIRSAEVANVLNSIVAPARAILTYQDTEFETSYEGNPFTGDPRPEHEQAWHELIKSRSAELLQQPSA